MCLLAYFPGLTDTSHHFSGGDRDSICICIRSISSIHVNLHGNSFCDRIRFVLGFVLHGHVTVTTRPDCSRMIYCDFVSTEFPLSLAWCTFSHFTTFPFASVNSVELLLILLLFSSVSPAMPPQSARHLQSPPEPSAQRQQWQQQ